MLRRCDDGPCIAISESADVATAWAELGANVALPVIPHSVVNYSIQHRPRLLGAEGVHDGG